MNRLTPKKLEMQQREAKILDVARGMIVREGYHGLNMDRIAAGVSYSKGTVYNHFANKEEIIIALAIETSAKRVELFRRAAQFKGPSRFRMIAIGESAERFVRDYSDFFIFEEILKLDSVREKTSGKRQGVIRGCEMQCMEVVSGVVRDAVAAGDLKLPKHMSPEKLVFGLWSLTSGAFSIIAGTESLAHLGLEDPFELVREHTTAMLDGYLWRPLSSEYDTQKILKKIRKEVFVDG